jgi:hypothetical protein
MVPAERTDCSFLLARLHCGLAGNSRHTTVKSGRQIRMLVVLGVVVSTIGFFVLRPCDPLYEGKSISAWIADLGSNDRRLMEPAHKTLVQIGAPAIPHLVTTIEKRQSWFHSTYLKFWSSRKLPEFVRRRLPAPISHAYLAGLNAVGVLGLMGSKAGPAVPALVQTLQDDDLVMRINAAQALGMIGKEARPAIFPLAALLKEYENDTRKIATYSLIRIGDPTGKAIQPLTTLLNGTNNQTRISAAIALWLLEGESQPTLALLKRNADPEDWRTRFFTAYSLGEFGSSARAAVPALLDCLHDEHAAVRQHAAEALKKIVPEAAREAGVK